MFSCLFFNCLGRNRSTNDPIQKNHIEKTTHVWTTFSDSGHFQWRKYSVFHEESEFRVKIEQFQPPEAKTWETLP